MQRDIFIRETLSIKETLKQLDKTAKKVLLVIDDEGRLLGAIGDGDIRRYILSGKTLNDDIRGVYNKKPIYLEKEYFSIEKAKEIILKNKIELLPVVDKDYKVIDFVTWDQLFSEELFERPGISKINVPVVIMAGGRGIRLDPFTRVFPKPLIPIGDKSIAEIIIEEFKKQGVREYYLTLNHKSQIVEAYFNNIEKDYILKYVREDDFLGTAGSLKLLEDQINDIFIVSNCDVIVKANFSEVVKLHKEQKAYLTIISAIRYFRIPYGIIKFKEKGEVTDVNEKPEYTFTINTGVYVVAKDCLQFIPENSKFDMTDLMNVLLKNNRKLITYPVNENDYNDIGQWEEYKKAIDKLRQLK